MSKAKNSISKRVLSLFLAVIMIFGIVQGTTMQSFGLGEDLIKRYLEKNGIIGYLYNPQGHYFYTAEEPWQHVFGFNDAYDLAAPFVVMFYDTVTFDFSYDNKDWRIQLWKGQYGWVFIGAEIGIYTKSKNLPIEHYSSPAKEDYLGTSLKLTRFGFWKQFETNYAKRWWCTGFVPGSLVLFAWRGQLRMDARITMKDKEMLRLFTNSVRAQGVAYSTDGLDVYIKY